MSSLHWEIKRQVDIHEVWEEVQHHSTNSLMVILTPGVAGFQVTFAG